MFKARSIPSIASGHALARVNLENACKLQQGHAQTESNFNHESSENGCTKNDLPQDNFRNISSESPGTDTSPFTSIHVFKNGMVKFHHISKCCLHAVWRVYSLCLMLHVQIIFLRQLFDHTASLDQSGSCTGHYIGESHLPCRRSFSGQGFGPTVQ